MTRASLLIAFGVGCRAETLGVEVPRGGPDAISVEDLQRDARALLGPDGVRRPGTPGHRAVTGHFAQRLQQMRMLPGFGREWQTPLEDDGLLVCGMKDGSTEMGVVVLARDPGDGAARGPVDLAGLVSLAKAYDTPARPAATLVICGQFSGDMPPTLGGRPPVPASQRSGAVVVVAGLGGGVGPPSPGPELGSGGETVQWPGGAGPAAATLDAVDYRVVASDLEALYREIEARMR